MFANPEDAAEFIGFDLVARAQGGALYESNGEKYFVVDGHMHYWNAAPDNWVPGAENYAEGWIKCFHAYQSLGPRRRTGRWSTSSATPRTT